MTTDLFNDAGYIALCGSRTVLDVVSTLISIFDRHDPGSYEAKTVGRVVDLPAIRKEISSLRPVLEESRKLSDYFRKTALYLQERESAAKKHMERLLRQEKEQEKLREEFKASIRRPTLPKDVTDRVLDHVSLTHWLTWPGEDDEDGGIVIVDGLIPFAVYNPSLLLPHYKRKFSAEWKLEDTAKEELKVTVLKDVALINHVTLHVKTWSDISYLRPLMTYPHWWKKLDIFVEEFDVDDFIDVFKPCLPHLEELHVQPSGDDSSVTSSGVVRCPRLKTTCSTAHLPLSTFSDLFNFGILDSITSLTLIDIKNYLFCDHNAFKKALNDLPLVLSRLYSLRELVVGGNFIKYDHTDMEDLQRVHSTSLHSLEVGYAFSNNTAIALLDLFAGCSIDCITVYAKVLQEAERLFNKARHVVCRGYVPDELLERKRDGSLAFPEMVHMELLGLGYLEKDELLQFQNRFLENVRMRYDDPTVCRIGHLRIPREFVTNRQFQDELERYVPSLFLFSLDVDNHPDAY